MNLLAKTAVGMTLIAWMGVAQQPAQPPLDQASQNSASPNVGRSLDEKVENLRLQAAELDDALADLGKQVGISITIDDSALEFLPWGGQTKLADLTITGASLREALSQILGALGLTYEVRETGIVVLPTAPLQRMERRASWDDLKLLRRCSETEYSPQNLDSFKFQYRLSSKVDGPKMLQHQLERAGQGSVADVLEAATSALGWVWFAENDHIVVRTRQAQVANQLARRITVRYANVPLSQILVELAQKADVPFSMEPGMMVKLPPSTAQSYTLLLQSTSIRQALELIAAETGVKYLLDNEGVKLSLVEMAEGGKPVSTRSSPYVAKIVVPAADGSYSFEYLLRADELPEELADARQQMLQEFIQKAKKDIAPPQPPATNAPGR